jgi:hypothetical protein
MLECLETRIVPYSVSGNAWPNSQVVTISFVPDGTVIGSNGYGPITSNLQSAFNSKFGSTSTWENAILKAAQSYAQQTNINFVVIPDSGAQTGSGPDQQGDPTMGDIRIAGYTFPNTSLGMAYMPPPANNFSAAGDIFLNTAMPFHIGSTYDLYTVAAHEIGHALGLSHSAIVSAVMYGIYDGVKTGLSSDDINGIRSIYSGGNARTPDRFDSGAGNNSFATATDITSSVNPSSLTGVLTGLDITTTSDADYYVVGGNVPTNGGNLTVQVQSQGLSLLAPTVTVYAADQQTVLASASGAGQYGTTLSVTVSGVGQGSPVYIKVAGADSTAFGTGAYALTLNTGTGPNPTVPLPNTTLPNGTPFHSGGGVALDSFGLTDTDAVPAAAAAAAPHPAAPVSTAAAAAFASSGFGHGTPMAATGGAVFVAVALSPSHPGGDAGATAFAGPTPSVPTFIASAMAGLMLGTTGVLPTPMMSISITAMGTGEDDPSHADDVGVLPVREQAPQRTDGDTTELIDACFVDTDWMNPDPDE